MKSTKLAVLVFGILGVIQVGRAVNYCLSTYSCGSTINIGCNNTGAFAAACPAGTLMVDMTPALKTAILNSHNTKRNTIAGGNLPGFQPAVRMATMVWDDELALLASYNAKRCLFAHDACRNTAKFKWAGQNLAKTWWSGGTVDVAAIISGQIDAWWSEYKDANMTQINSYPSNPPKVIGHFTVMTAEKNVALGCAGILYKDPAMNNWNSSTLVCNYARTNIINYPMYTSGPTASQCTTGTNPSYPALCSVNETYAVNVP